MAIVSIVKKWVESHFVVMINVRKRVGHVRQSNQLRLLPIRLNCIIYETTVLICQGANFVNANVLQCCCIESATVRTSLNMS